MKKVYCEKCKNLDIEGYCCSTKPYYKDTPYRRELKYVDTDIRNKNNDCKYFEKKEPTSELKYESLTDDPLMVSNPPLDEKKKHWWNK